MVRAVSQHMFDLSEKSSISTFFNDHDREMSQRGRRFDFRTICDPACQAVGRHQPAWALACIPRHRQGKVRQASPHFSYAGNLIQHLSTWGFVGNYANEKHCSLEQRQIWALCDHLGEREGYQAETPNRLNHFTSCISPAQPVFRYPSRHKTLPFFFQAHMASIFHLLCYILSMSRGKTGRQQNASCLLKRICDHRNIWLLHTSKYIWEVL